MEERLFETESTQTREEAADYLRSVADRLDAGGEVTFEAGGETVTVAVPASLTFEVAVERETGAGPDETSVEFELEWTEGEAADAGDLSVS
ncbi:MAG: amphi-Trp domain-containing protein [Halobacteriaceae archaeon]